MTFSLSTQSYGTTRVVSLSGELDIATAPKLRRALLELLSDSPDPLLVDMAGVSFMDSSGLAVLVAGHKRAKFSNARFAVSRLGPAVAKVFALTRADQLMPVLDEIAEPPLAPV